MGNRPSSPSRRHPFPFLLPHPRAGTSFSTFGHDAFIFDSYRDASFCNVLGRLNNAGVGRWDFDAYGVVARSRLMWFD